ncbi:MAG TPA: ferritin [Bacteroidia bacterium]|nr:ferritin [Bacteroidia bacterium]HNT79306.1 ferritin [Bacteroidia bacterium]
MISKKIEKLLNRQIELEAMASQHYLAMASWAEVKGFSGIPQFLYKHSDEERMHMLKLFGFINERGGHAQVPALKSPTLEYKSVNQLFEQLLKHEVMVSAEINKLVEETLKEKDYTTHNFLQWYVAEQIEEERLARNILDKLKLIGNDKSGLYLFDRDLGSMAASDAH